MTVLLVAKKLRSLYPVDDAGEDFLSHLAQGEIIEVTIRRPRNIKHHRKFFAMLQLVFSNQNAYKSLDDLLEVCKLSIGHCRTIRTKVCDVKIPNSISFSSLDQDAFNDFYDRAVQWVIADVIPGLRREDLDEEVEAELMTFGGDAHR